MNKKNILENNLEKVIETVFSKDPKPPCTYSISLSNELIEKKISPFQLLMTILVDGAKYLFGQNITPDQITEKQFDLLKMYMESIGYSIKYNYNNNIQLTEQPKIINIWFEEYIMKYDCHGRIVY
jgi:hypothetical protein